MNHMHVLWISFIACVYGALQGLKVTSASFCSRISWWNWNSSFMSLAFQLERMCSSNQQGGAGCNPHIHTLSPTWELLGIISVAAFYWQTTCTNCWGQCVCEGSVWGEKRKEKIGPVQSEIKLSSCFLHAHTHTVCPSLTPPRYPTLFSLVLPPRLPLQR